MENFWDMISGFLKVVWVLVTSAMLAIISYFDPIVNFIVAILIMFLIDLILGITSGRKLNKEPISFKKGFLAVILFGVYVTIVAVPYILGNLMCDESLMAYVIKTISWATIYLYSVNISKNLKRVFPSSRLIAFLYYFLNVEFLNNFPSLKNFLKKANTQTEDKK